MSEGSGNRVRGVVLLDAVYGELDKFASWVANNRSGFFRQCLYALHPAARSGTDADDPRQGHRHFRMTWMARCAPAVSYSSKHLKA